MTVSFELPQELAVKIAVVAAVNGISKAAAAKAMVEEYADGYSAEELSNLEIYPDPVPRKRKTKTDA